MALKDGTWLLVASCGPRRAVTLHPPLDPEFITIGIWSDDEGSTWSHPAPVPGYGATGTECGGLTVLPDGGVLLNHWRFRWYDAAAGEAVLAAGEEPLLATPEQLRVELDASLELDGGEPEGVIQWAHGGGAMTAWRTDGHSRPWQFLAEPDIEPFSNGFGLRGGAVTADGDLLLPLSDPPHYRRVFLIRSRDGGQSWSTPEPVAIASGAAFEEASMVLLGGGVLLMLLRDNHSRQLQATWSHDGGASWSTPRAAGLHGFPAHLLRLADGRLAALTAVCDLPGTILLSASNDDGETWQNPTVIADNLGTHDLGYPTAVEARDGSLFAAYYRRDALGVTGIVARRVQFPHPA